MPESYIDWKKQIMKEQGYEDIRVSEEDKRKMLEEIKRLLVDMKTLTYTLKILPI